MEDYYTTYDYSSAADTVSQVTAVGVIVLAVVFLLMTLVSVLMLIALWRVFTKAGKPGWASLVPIYNTVVMLEIVGRPLWWILLMFVPFVNIVISIIVTLDLVKAFGKSTGFGILAVLFPVIMYPILAFGDSQYGGPVAADNRPTPPAVGASAEQ